MRQSGFEDPAPIAEEEDEETQRALNDLDEIICYIAADDADAAARFGSSLLDHVELLGRFPRLGALTRKRSRVRKIAHSPILVYYRIDEGKQQIEILHLRHGSRYPAKF